MMRRLLPAFVLPLFVTAIALASVAWNRSSGRGPIVLTEREVYVNRASEDNTMARARIWHLGVPDDSRISKEMLTAVGFDMSVDPGQRDAARFYGRQLPKRAWVAFELGGESLLPQEMRFKGPRLVPIDVARDADALTARYPDAARYLITSGVVRSMWLHPTGQSPRVVGTIDSIDPAELHVPRELVPALRGQTFRISVMYGRRFEPWIVGVSH